MNRKLISSQETQNAKIWLGTKHVRAYVHECPFPKHQSWKEENMRINYIWRNKYIYTVKMKKAWFFTLTGTRCFFPQSTQQTPPKSIKMMSFVDITHPQCKGWQNKSTVLILIWILKVEASIKSCVTYKRDNTLSLNS